MRSSVRVCTELDADNKCLMVVFWSQQICQLNVQLFTIDGGLTIGINLPLNVRKSSFNSGQRNLQRNVNGMFDHSPQAR